ncbi:MAG: threonine ammonia-lyase [Myxococcales bacterium]|nr:threonine ammonia-lyase [Myxococcales bacterium]USN50510.1 MAG: threonine ammonia-lyase [Myxococcales bacterium]
MFTNKQIENAHLRIKDNIVITPCIFSPYLSKLTSGQVYLKLENMQHTGSFKERGALNFLLSKQSLSLRHVVAASAGNHAQAVAFHARRLGVKATIFMPIGTSNTKILQTQRYGADVKLVGQNYDEAYSCAKEFAIEHEAEYVHAYNDVEIITGQATIGLEIQNQIGVPDYMFAPIGGGGLFAGIAKYFANLSGIKKVQMIGVEAMAFQSMAQALDKGSPFSLAGEKTIADGIAVRRVGELTHKICDELQPKLVGVDDYQIQRAIMLLLERQKIVTEGAGATATAGMLLERFKDELVDKKIVVIVSGGNIDISLLSRLTGQELINSGRLCRLSLIIKDTPGSLSHLLSTITKASGNIVDIQHERSFAVLKWNEVMVIVTIETRDEIHEHNLLMMLEQESYKVETLMGNSVVG